MRITMKPKAPSQRSGPLSIDQQSRGQVSRFSLDALLPSTPRRSGTC